MPSPVSEQLLSWAELHRSVAARQLEFSDSQLKRLRREGLLPVDGQRHRPGVRGSESLYPSWVVGQLELVAGLMVEERRFAHLRVLVRWNGGWVRPGKLRESLVGLLEAMSAQARRSTASTIDEGDRADRLAEVMTRYPGRSGVSRLMRQRLGSVEDIQRAAYAFAALATRSQLEWENHDPNNSTESLLTVFERATGFDRARRDDIGGNGPLIRERESTKEILAELQEAGLFDILDLGTAFENASDEAIDRAFADAIAIADLREAFDAIQSVAGRDVAGLGSITELGAADKAIDLAALVRGLLLLRPLIPEGALEGIVEAAARSGPQLRAARELARAMPHLVPYFGPTGAEQLDALLAEERDRITSEVRAYLETRPELLAPLQAEGDAGEQTGTAEHADALRSGDRP